jgi:hypothetical protein
MVEQPCEYTKITKCFFQRGMERQFKNYVLKGFWEVALVARSYNPRYSGGRNQEDYGSKPAWANSFMRPFLEKTHHKKGLEEWHKVQTLNSSPSTKKKKALG